MDKNILLAGDIILVHDNGIDFLGAAIRLLTKSYWNHTGIYTENIDKQGFIIEAEGRGVVRTPVEEYLGNSSYDLKVVRVRPEAFKNADEYNRAILTALSRADAEVGTKYDWWAIAWLGLVYMFKGVYNRVSRNPWQERNRFFCSELVCYCFSGTSSIIKNIFAGDNVPQAQCDTITPKDIGKTKWVRYIWGKDVV